MPPAPAQALCDAFLTEPEAPPRRPFVWSFRRPGRSPLWRFFAHLLIRLLVISPLPPQLQAAAVLFPVSLLWPLLSPDEAAPAEPGPAADPGPGDAEGASNPAAGEAPEGALGGLGAAASAGQRGVCRGLAHRLGFTIKILIINAGNGVVVTFTADNDGAVGVIFPATFPATIDDRLFVSITFPDGTVTSFERSKYVNPVTGETAIGSGGGTVDDPAGSGLQLRVPEGAFENGVVLKVLPVGEAAFPNAPNWVDEGGTPVAHFGAGVKVEASRDVAVKKELDLAFPLPDFTTVPEGQRPPNAKDAFYYIYRKVELGDGKVVYEVVDHAFVEGEGAGARVVTACYPLMGVVLGGTVALYVLMWTYNALMGPGVPWPGVVTGRVYRSKWNPSGGEPGYTPLGGAQVRVWDAAGNKLTDLVATTQGCAESGACPGEAGRFTLWDRRVVDGPVTIAVAAPGASFPADTNPCAAGESDPASPIRCATAYQDTDNMAAWQTTGLRPYRYIATANVTYPAEEPPPAPPAVNIDLLKVVDGVETMVSGGIVTEGTALRLRLTARTTDPSVQPSVTDATLQGASCTRTPVVAGDWSTVKVDLQTDANCSVSATGTYTVVATALSPGGGTAQSSRSFLVVASGGSNTAPVAGPPQVLSIVPPNGRTGVPVTVFPKVEFSEPVKIPVGAVQLREAGGSEVPIKVIAVTRTGEVVPDLFATPGSEVTSITLQPAGNLRYGMQHAIELGTAIVDTDAEPQAFAGLTNTFTTFGPTPITVDPQTPAYASPGIVVLGARAYLVENSFYAGRVRVFDVSDPASPQEKLQQVPPATPEVLGRPVDVVGWEPEGGARYLVVGSGSTNVSRPSNVNLYDVSQDNRVRWLGAASVAASATEGFIARLAVKGATAYAATTKRGVQVIDLGRVESIFSALTVGSSEYRDAISALVTSGRGFGQDAVVQTVAVRDAQGRPENLVDLEAEDYVFATAPSTSRRMVVATGLESALVVVDTASGEIPFKGPLTKGDVSLTMGQAIGVGRVGQQAVVAVAGTGTVGTAGGRMLLAVVDMSAQSAPQQPQVTAIVPLDGEGGLTGLPTDVAVTGDLVLVATAGEVGLVSLSNLQQPRLIGKLAGLGGRLALSGDGLVFSTARSVFGGSGMGGIHVATLGATIPVLTLSRAFLMLDKNNRSTKDLEMTYRLVPTADGVQSMRIEISTETGAPLAPPEARPVAAEGTYVWPKGQTLEATPRTMAFDVRNPDGTASGWVPWDEGRGPRVRQVLPSPVPYLPPDAPPTETTEVRIQGAGFESGAKVYARMNQDAEQLVPSTFVSDTELRVNLGTRWRKRETVVCLVAGTTYGQARSCRKVVNEEPVLSAPAIVPTLFFARDDARYLLKNGDRIIHEYGDYWWLNSCHCNGRALDDDASFRDKPPDFQGNPEAFQVGVRDLDLAEPEAAALRLETCKAASGGVDQTGGCSAADHVDEILDVQLHKAEQGLFLSGDTPEHPKGASRIAVVTNKVDDGAIPFSEWVWVSGDTMTQVPVSPQNEADRFTRGDGGVMDMTIRMTVSDDASLGALSEQEHLGGVLWVRYRNQGATDATGGPLEAKPLKQEICPKRLRQRVELNLVVPTGATIPLTRAISIARSIWAEACLSIDVVSVEEASVEGMSIGHGEEEIPEGHPKYPPEFDGTGTKVHRTWLSDDARALADQRGPEALDAAVVANQVTVFFVPTISDGLYGFAAVDGLEARMQPFHQYVFTDEIPRYRGLVFIATSLGEDSIGKVLAHELGHHILGRTVGLHADELWRTHGVAADMAVRDGFNIMHHRPTEGPTGDALMTKRLTREQVRAIQNHGSRFIHVE